MHFNSHILRTFSMTVFRREERTRALPLGIKFSLIFMILFGKFGFSHKMADRTGNPGLGNDCRCGSLVCSTTIEKKINLWRKEINK